MNDERIIVRAYRRRDDHRRHRFALNRHRYYDPNYRRDCRDLSHHCYDLSHCAWYCYRVVNHRCLFVNACYLHSLAVVVVVVVARGRR